MKKKSNFKKTLVKLVGVTVIAVGSLYYLKFGNKNIVPLPSYTVTKVFDGDTFVTKENLGIRLALLDAPEKDLCGYRESKEALEKLVLNKTVYLKILTKDGFGRLVALVYNSNGLINAKMIEGGHAFYLKKEDVTNEVLNQVKTANANARNNKLGIYNDKCSQMVNLENPNCNIKGNLSAGNNLYLTPSCQVYKQTIVQKFLGDRWFCTESEAVKAGFKKAKQCD